MARLGLQSIADFLNNVDGYIEACSFKNKLNDDDHFEIAKRLIKNKRAREAIEWLDKMEIPTAHIFPDWQKDQMTLKIETLDFCGYHQRAQVERQKWFDVTLNPKIYYEILNHGEAGFVKSWKKTAIEKAFKFQDSNVALNFLREIQEFEQAAKLVYQKIDVCSNDYYLRPVADILRENHPLAATLLYRKMMEPYLKDINSKYYHNAAKDLAVCDSLSSKITNWQGFKNHKLYFEELSLLLKKKRSFWSEYTLALGKGKDVEVTGAKRRKNK